MPISRKVSASLQNASFIRKMFEEGLRLRAQVGADKVFDFSLGNPVMEPPAAFREALERAVHDPTPGTHRYMSNAGLPSCRTQVAEYVARVQGVGVVMDDVVMTCGAGAALNVVLKTLLDPGDEVVVVAPYFPEYNFYVDNHGGVVKVAQSTESFDLDLENLDAVVGEHTKALIINSPNNPTGRMYSAETLQALGGLLAAKEARFGRPITLISDEPYRKIVFDDRPTDDPTRPPASRPAGGRVVPSVFAAHSNVVYITSHSKDLGLAGERIGYAVVSPHHQDRAAIRDAMVFTNRTLGFVNAPALFQRAAAAVQDASVDIAAYQALRDLFWAGLTDAGLKCYKPEGAFYLFPEAPNRDDLGFIDALRRQYILAVPGRGFARPGYVRFCFCFTQRDIEGALPGIRRAVQEMKG